MREGETNLTIKELGGKENTVIVLVHHNCQMHDAQCDQYI